MCSTESRAGSAGTNRGPAAPRTPHALFVFSASLKAQESQKWFHFNKYLLCSVLIFFKTERRAVRAQLAEALRVPRLP